MTIDSLNLAGREPIFAVRASLAELVDELVAREGSFRPERLSGIHNPWGLAAGLTDPWVFLEVCESSAIVSAAETIIGPDIILWDAELYLRGADYLAFVADGREGRYWPIEPKQGAVALVAPKVPFELLGVRSLDDVETASGLLREPDQPLLVVRLMPGASRFSRDPDHLAHVTHMNERVLLNYAERPLWLLGGKNTGENDLVTGFAPAVPTWANTADPNHIEER